MGYPTRRLLHVTTYNISHVTTYYIRPDKKENNPPHEKPPTMGKHYQQLHESVFTIKHFTALIIHC